jgi:hypothetical protein
MIQKELKNKNKMKKFFIITLIITGNVFSLHAQKIDTSNNLFREMWLADTCGGYGYRKALASFISTNFNSDEKKLLENETDVLNALGRPDSLYLREEDFVYIYVISGSLYCNLSDDQTIFLSLSIAIDNKTRKILFIAKTIHG